jgi:hypothetical protein
MADSALGTDSTSHHETAMAGMTEAGRKGGAAPKKPRPIGYPSFALLFCSDPCDAVPVGMVGLKNEEKFI